MEDSLIYLDNAATTRVNPLVVAAMSPYFTDYYGNPSAIYSFASKTKTDVDAARKQVANLIGANFDEITLQQSPFLFCRIKKAFAVQAVQRVPRVL